MNLIIRFDEEDMKEILRVATIRNKPKVDAGYPSGMHARDLTPEQGHIMGVAAETAVGHYIDAPIDKSYKPYGDKGEPDLYKNGFSLEVKGRRDPEPDFIIPHSSADPRRFKADIAVSCYEVEPFNIVRIAGWTTKEFFLDNYHIKDYGKGPRAAIAFHKMWDIGYLLTYIKPRD